jgi:murein DD-endopeptidase MepM/ murein hydrolase activator NlpD
MIRVFPVAAGGAPHYADDFTRGKHDGVDIFADEGTPVLAVDDGELRFAEDPKGGHAFYLKASDGAVYYGAHLSAYEGQARPVVAGDVIAYVGHTGNAAGTSPHLHFEIHPSGGVAVDPFEPLSTVTPGAVALPPSPTPPDALPPLVAPAPVPPIPHAPRGPNAGPVVFLLAALGITWAVAR